MARVPVFLDDGVALFARIRLLDLFLYQGLLSAFFQFYGFLFHPLQSVTKCEAQHLIESFFPNRKF